MIKLELLSLDMIDEILKLENICFPDDPWGRISFETEVDNPLSLFIVAKDEDNAEIVGYGGVRFMYDIGDITNIAVSPKYRREGIGERILEIITQACIERGMVAMNLEVREGNEPAIKLYEKMGYIACGLRKGYYKGKYDAILMTKDL